MPRAGVEALPIIIRITPEHFYSIPVDARGKLLCPIHRPIVSTKRAFRAGGSRHLLAQGIIDSASLPCRQTSCQLLCRRPQLRR